MIKKLGKQINFIFFAFFVIIIILLSLFFNYAFQRAEITKYHSYVRNTVYEEDLDSFLNGKNVENLYYCTFHRTDKESPFKLINNFIPDCSNNEALTLFQTLHQSSVTDKNTDIKNNYIQIRRRDTIIFVSKTELNNTFAHLYINTIIVDVVLIIGFFFITKFLSKKIINPVIENEKKEKRFVSNTSHELKTPLTIIKANIDILEKEIGYNKSIEYISSETARMTKLINNMMELNNVCHINQKKRMNISEAVLSVLLPFESVAYDNGNKYILNIDDNIFINGNYRQIQSLVSILIDNAIAYSRQGGTIKVTLSCAGNKCCLSVSNQGNPIPKEKQKLIFDRFYREDESRNEADNHFGLGLAIASGIADSHNAKISVTSEKGVNTFAFTFKRL